MKRFTLVVIIGAALSATNNAKADDVFCTDNSTVSIINNDIVTINRDNNSKSLDFSLVRQLSVSPLEANISMISVTVYHATSVDNKAIRITSLLSSASSTIIIDRVRSTRVEKNKGFVCSQ